MTLVEDLNVDGSPGFTVWPATSNAGDYAADKGGTEYFLSTIAGDGSETGNPTGTARRIGLWALTNTSSLDAFTPALAITSRLINSQDYVFPPLSNQKAGSIPLGDCINDTTTPTPFGPGCWQLFFVDEPAHDEVESTPDSATPACSRCGTRTGCCGARTAPASPSAAISRPASRGTASARRSTVRARSRAR